MTGVNHLEHILSSDAPPDPGTRHVRGADGALGQELAYDRREDQRLGSIGLVRRRRFGCRCRRRGWRRSHWRSGLVRRRRFGYRCRRRGWRRSHWRSLGLRRGGSRCWGGFGDRRRGIPALGPIADDSQLHPDVDRLAFRHENRREHSCGRRRDLGVNLVRRYFEQGLIALDLVTHGLHPTGDRPFRHRLAQLRHRHISQRAVPFRSTPSSFRRRLRRAMGAAE